MQRRALGTKMKLRPARGLLALSSSRDGSFVGAIASLVRHREALRAAEGTNSAVMTWGHEGSLSSGNLWVLSLGPRRHEEDLSPGEIGKFIQELDMRALAQIMPPFAAVSAVPDSGK